MIAAAAIAYSIWDSNLAAAIAGGVIFACVSTVGGMIAVLMQFSSLRSDVKNMAGQIETFTQDKDLVRWSAIAERGLTVSIPPKRQGR